MLELVLEQPQNYINLKLPNTVLTKFNIIDKIKKIIRKELFMEFATKCEQNLDTIPSLVNRHLASFSSENSEHTDKATEILKSLRFLLNGHYEKYDFDEGSISSLAEKSLSEEDFHKVLYSLNEKQQTQKVKGIFNTPDDTVSFIVSRCAMLCGENIAYKTMLDPTCGSGEFLLNILKTKLENSYDSIGVLSTIFGNDNDILAIEICKVRLFFEMTKWVSVNQYIKVAEILNRNLTNYDFVNIDTEIFNEKFDLILGNPPYVEDIKSEIKPKSKFGNIYANVLQNSIDLLKEDGMIGFIIPISYVATARMRKIRKYIEENTNWQYIYNYADRPSCLFSGVHQKLTILLAQKGQEQHKIFTSNYQYWYKEERDILFENSTTVANKYVLENYYPKLGNEIKHKLFDKIHTNQNDGITSLQKQGNPNVYLNMRACFWIKAFSFPQLSSEFKEFSFEESYKWSILALLNSSLFWWHWICVSDCWHITKKELDTIRVPKALTASKELVLIAKELENKLEETKLEINSKQTAYEYKHKLCKSTIDKIDDYLGEIYGLTLGETKYIKEFATKYREGLGA